MALAIASTTTHLGKDTIPLLEGLNPPPPLANTFYSNRRTLDERMQGCKLKFSGCRFGYPFGA